MLKKNDERLANIVRLVEEKGYLSVADLSRLLRVSEMTIRRDLVKLFEQKRIQRTYGGAATNPPDHQASTPRPVLEFPISLSNNTLLRKAGTLIAASLTANHSTAIQEISTRYRIPLISESYPMEKGLTCVGRDDYSAGTALGLWAGDYANRHWSGRASVLDLTYHLFNTEERSRGFLDGLRQVVTTAPEVLSLNPQCQKDLAYQLTRDALSVNSQINIIFATNDTIALGAIEACKDLRVDPAKLILVTFGLEGDSMKNMLASGLYCRAGLAMFPEVVGPECVEAAIGSYNRRVLPERIDSPYAVLTQESLPEFYALQHGTWQLRWEAVRSRLGPQYDYETVRSYVREDLPGSIGIVLTFSEHEWYQKLVDAMKEYGVQLGIDIQIIDAEQTLKDEIENRRREIARCAAQEVRQGDVIFIDVGPIACYLAEYLGEVEITVITNYIPIFDLLKASPKITLILTGGILRRNSQALVGPVPENVVRDLRADKLFLSASGITNDFGLSHAHMSEVRMKQALIRSAREVILLADYTCFGQESVIQVAPLSAVHKVITDDAVAASIRIQLSQLGIKVTIAKT